METSPYNMNQIDSDLRLPPRKRLLAGYMKLNGSSSSSSSSASYSNGSSSSSSSSSASTHVLTSRFNNDHQNQSPEDLAEAARSAAASAVKAAKAARALANEKALISSKAIAAAKKALEVVDSFPKETKHVSLDQLYLYGYKEDDLARRLQRAIDRMYPKVLATREENGRMNKKKQKMSKNVAEGGSRVTSYMDSDSSHDGSESNRKASKAFEHYELNWIPTPGKEKGEEQRRGRVKLKKFPLSICNSSGISSCESPVPEDDVIPVIPGSSSGKC